MKGYSKNPVGAHYGLRDWLLQRLTAVVMAIFTLGLLACVAWHQPSTHADWKGLFSGTVARLATMLFFVSLLYHAWVGMRDIFMDYIKPVYPRLALQAAVALTLLAYLIWTASILWGAPQ